VGGGGGGIEGYKVDRGDEMRLGRSEHGGELGGRRGGQVERGGKRGEGGKG